MMAQIQSWFFSNDDKKEHAKALDGLRGIAIMLVLLSHASNNNMFFHPSLAFNGIGKGGVYLFYVLSAYLLDRQIVKALMNKTADLFFWKRYVLRRILRIYPVFILSLVVFWILSSSGITTVIQSDRDILSHIFLFEGKEVFWSIPVEFKYYILSPFLLLICHYYLKWNLKKVAIFICILSICTLFIDFYFQFNRISTLKYLTVFLTGTFLAIYHLNITTALSEKQSRAIGITGFAAMIFCIVMNPNYMGHWMGMDTSNNGRKVMLVYALLSGIMLYAALYSNNLFKRLLENRVLRFIGTISFSIYLFHMPVIYILESGIINIPQELKIYFFFGTTMLISMITYLLIERPVSHIRITRHTDVKDR